MVWGLGARGSPDRFSLQKGRYFFDTPSHVSSLEALLNVDMSADKAPRGVV